MFQCAPIATGHNATWHVHKSTTIFTRIAAAAAALAAGTMQCCSWRLWGLPLPQAAGGRLHAGVEYGTQVGPESAHLYPLVDSMGISEQHSMHARWLDVFYGCFGLRAHLASITSL